MRGTTPGKMIVHQYAKAYCNSTPKIFRIDYTEYTLDSANSCQYICSPGKMIVHQYAKAYCNSTPKIFRIDYTEYTLDSANSCQYICCERYMQLFF
jgi:hypothetical protein